MDKGDIEKNESEKNTIQILIPVLNEYLLKDIKHWAKSAYAHARRQVHWRKAQKIKAVMPINTAAYAEDKVFGNWRLVAPAGPGQVSPLQQVMTLIRDEIVPTRPVRSADSRVNKPADSSKTLAADASNRARWAGFRRNFVREIKLDFNAIYESDYDPKMVDEVNGRLNHLLSQYTREKDGVRINFVLKPETAEDYSSPRFLAIRSRIWERFTGKPLDLTMFLRRPGSLPLAHQMEMELNVEIKYKT